MLRMPSGEIRRVDVRCRATVGEVGNAEWELINWGKAGRTRYKGRRPHVRTIAGGKSKNVGSSNCPRSLDSSSSLIGR